MYSRIIIFFVFGLVLSGCANAFLVREYRTSYELKHFDGLMVTNLMFSEHSYHPRMSHGSVEITYPFITENINETASISLDLKRAAFVIFETSIPVHCQAKESGSEMLELTAGQRVKVECRVSLEKDQNPKFIKEDAFGQFKIPFYTSSEKKSDLITLNYKIKIEDFQL